MKKEKKILLNFSLYFLVFLLLIFYGISHPKADVYNTTYDDTQTYYDNSGTSVSAVGQTWNSSLQAYVSNSFTTTANSYGGLVVFNSPISLLNNHTYSLSISFVERYNIALSSKPGIAISTSITGAKDNYVNRNYNTNTLVNKVVNNSILQYSFTAYSNASYIALPWTTTSTTTQTYILNQIIIEDLGTEGVSESTINNSLNNQTTIINNSILASQNEITTNSDNNRDLIINNQNANNEALIENDNANTDKLIENDKVCYQYDKNIIVKNGYFLTSSGGEYANNASGISDYLKINSSSELSIITTIYQDRYACFYNTNKSLISCYNQNGKSGKIDIPNNTEYFRFSYNIESDKPIYKICKSGSQATNDALEEQNKTSKGILGKLGDLLDYFNPTSENWFVKKLVDLLIDGLKSLFVPSQEELSDLIDSFKSTMETKLGAIYQVADLLVSVLRSILNPANSNSCMTFPEIKDPMFDKLLIEQTDYCFDSLRTDFGFVFTLSDMIISIVCTLAFANMLYKKYEAFIGGNSSDY